MGYESRFAESFAGWSHELPTADKAVRPAQRVRASESAHSLIPNIVKYRLLPGTAVAAIALTIPGLSPDADSRAQAPEFLSERTTAVASSALIVAPAPETVSLTPPLLDRSDSLSDALVVPASAGSVDLAVPLVSLEPAATPAVADASFAEAFAVFASASDETFGATVKAVALPEQTSASQQPTIEALDAIGPAIVVPALVARTVPGSLDTGDTRGVARPEFTAGSIPIVALTSGSLADTTLASITLEPVDMPSVEIPIAVVAAPALENVASPGLGSQMEPARSEAAIADFAVRPAPDSLERQADGPIQSPLPSTTVRSNGAAVAPQLSALPSTRPGGARVDALPIIVERTAVPAPVAKPALPGAQAGFTSVVDPRRPASLPVSGTVSGFDLDIQSRLITRIDGEVAGKLEFKQTNQSLAVRLGSIVELLRDRYDVSEFERISSSAASDVFVTMAQLRDAGIPITYDPVYDEFNVGTRDHRPANAHKVQIDQIGSADLGVGRSAIDQAWP